MNERILRVMRGDTTALYRLRLLEDGSATLERFEAGRFGPPRTFRDACEATVSPTDAASSTVRMTRAIEHVTAFLDGAVTVGEREVLSPTSAATRNARWFPGDIQMLGTSFFYVRELFPSARFHVSQLFRRVFGDIAFLALVVVSCGLWLRTDTPVASRRAALALQLASLVAVFGFDRFWEPMRLRLRRLRAATLAGPRWRVVLLAPLLVMTQLLLGTASVALSTLLGLANLVIHPAQVWGAWRQLAGGRALEWKASSVNAGQDARGWPLAAFRAAYRPVLKVGGAAAGLGLWLVALGAPVELLGINGLGLFLCSFLTVVLYAWWAGLPETSEGAPLYQLPRRELAALTVSGLLGSLATVALVRKGLYPLPAFEGSFGVVMLFLSLSAVVALVFPAVHLVRRRLHARRRPVGQRRWPVAVGALIIMTFLVTCHSDEVLSRSPRGGPSRAVLHLDERQWRMPEPERHLYEEIERTRRRHAEVDPEPLLRAEADQPVLAPTASVPTPDLRELRGVPAPRLPRLNALEALELPELDPVPPTDRVFVFKPRRRREAPVEVAPVAPTPVESGRRATDVAQRRAAAVTPRRLSPDELRAQERFIASSRFPWMTGEDLRRLGQADAKGERLPLVELARAYRWDAIQDLWDAVPAARLGGATDRVRFQRLRDGVEGVTAIGGAPTAREVERYLGAEQALVERWSSAYPHLPFGALRESPVSSPGRFSQITRFLLERGMTRDELGAAWRLDYVDAYWNAPALADGESIQQVFRDRPRTQPWERFELDWEGNAALAQRWSELQTEQTLATRIWQAGATGGANPTPQQLRLVVAFVAKILGALLRGDRTGPYASLARLFALDGIESQAPEARDPTAALWAARVWTEVMAGRVAKVVTRASAEMSLPGTADDRALAQKIARERFPDDGSDPMVRRALDWLVLIDNSETTAELAAGYDEYVRELAERGARPAGLPRAPRLSEAQVDRDLVALWRELPRRFRAIPARDDLVAELLCRMAYFSSRNGRDERRPLELLDDFAPELRQVDEEMDRAPPPEVQALADHLLDSTVGRVSASARGRRFFAWWMVATHARALRHELDRHGLHRVAAPEPLARDWADVLRSGARRWPLMPWSQPGFADFFLDVRTLEGWSVDELWRRFGDQLSDAEKLMARHVVPSPVFEALVERRIQEKTGAFPLDPIDPIVRRANAVMALARLLEVARINQVDGQAAGGFDGNPARLAERLSALYERVSRDYPHLDWDSEGTLEWCVLIGLRQGWDVERTVARFAPEWSVANALAASGWLTRLRAAAQAREGGGAAPDRALVEYVDAQADRLEERTKLATTSPRARAMNALLALSALILSAAQEGQLPEQHGAPWTEARVRRWATALGSQGPATSSLSFWPRALVETWSELLRAMRAEGPRFPWQRGAIVETNLLAMGGSGVSVSAMRAGHGAAWRLASDLVGEGFVVPAAFVDMVLKASEADLRRKLAAARGVAEHEVPQADVEPEDASLVRLDAVLALAEALSELRTSHGSALDPVTLARRLVEVQTVGRQRFPFVPWAEKGFTAAFVVAAARKDFRDDPWRYADLVGMAEVNRLLAELDRAERVTGLPPEVIADVRALMRAQTGHTPASDRVVVFQALGDGAFLLREFLPRVPRTLDAVITVARLRSAIRALDGAYPELHMVKNEDQSPRAGFADRLAVLAMKLALAAGDDPARPGFVAAAVARLEQSYLDGMSKILGPLRATLTAEERDRYEVTVRDQAREDNAARAIRFGLSAEALALPAVKSDDLVADAALYEILYASEIGQDQSYLGDVFAVFGVLRGRAEAQRIQREGLAAIDRRFAPELEHPGEPGYEGWRASSGYRAWWAARGELLQASRGRDLALARTLALVKRGAFSPDADPTTRASFARFGSFEDYLGKFLDAFEEAPRIPELAAALDELGASDVFLADGTRFALALFKCHVVNRLYPDARAASQALGGIAALLPAVIQDYRRILGFAPRFESGVPLYDARMSFLRRAAIGGGAGSDVYRRLNLVQRGVQRWTEDYFLKQAYKVLFFRELDADDPTPVARSASAAAGPARWIDDLADRALDRVHPRTRGDETTAFLEVRLPEALLAATGSNDLSVWLRWLMAHGEIGLDGEPTGRNPYAAEVDGYEARLVQYRERIVAGNAAGRSTRAERQRVRDIEREHASFQNQVTWLLEAAPTAARLTTTARRDYREACWLHAVLPLALLLGLGLLVRWLARWLGRRVRARLAPTLVTVGLLVWLPLGLAICLPLAVALRPANAAGGVARWLERVRLLERDDGPAGGYHRRGAAAQLAKLLPEAPPDIARVAVETGHAL